MEWALHNYNLGCYIWSLYQKVNPKLNKTKTIDFYVVLGNHFRLNYPELYQQYLTSLL